MISCNITLFIDFVDMFVCAIQSNLSRMFLMFMHSTISIEFDKISYHVKEELVNLRREVRELRKKAIETDVKVTETLDIVRELQMQVQVKEQVLENVNSAESRPRYYRSTFL